MMNVCPSCGATLKTVTEIVNDDGEKVPFKGKVCDYCGYQDGEVQYVDFNTSYANVASGANHTKIGGNVHGAVFSGTFPGGVTIGNTVVGTGNRGVAIGGNVSGATIITGEGKPEKYSPKFYAELDDALTHAFPNRNSLERMVAFGLNQQLNAIAGSGNLRDTVFQLMTWAKAQGKVDDLVIAAYTSNKTNPFLKKFVETYYN